MTNPKPTASSSSLYGTRSAKSHQAHEISSSTSLSFTSALSSLISSSAPLSTTNVASSRPRPTKLNAARFRPPKQKKSSRKRSREGLAEQKHHTSTDLGSVDAAALDRSKRRLVEKAAMYSDMKHGLYVSSTGRLSDERTLVDFDRKWAEQEERGASSDADSFSSFEHSDNEGDDNASLENEIVEYEDEFGRMRKGTKKQALREEKRRKVAEAAIAEAASLSVHPEQPENLIIGDTIQTAAFNPDAPIVAQMEKLARRRDRSPTPVEDTHYNAEDEVRNKGVGFYAFSQDKKQREEEMQALKQEREKTEQAKKQRKERIEKRKKQIEERRKLISKQHEEKRVNRFLDGLEKEILGAGQVDKES